MATNTSVDSWYEGLSKPAYNPPGWVFGLVWNLLYLLMGISLYLAWSSVSERAKNRAMVAFGVQLALNALWSLVFFGLGLTWGGVVVNVLLLLTIIWTMREFWPLSTWAAYLLIPYLAWVVFATFLNTHIAWLN